MRFYTGSHRYYCGIDLHARSMYVCVIDNQGEVLLHRNMKAEPEPLLQAIEPYREDIVIGVECIFTWYWLADLCHEQSIHFILGHALYMKAIHGGKAKNDRIDSRKIAVLMRGGTFPVAYVYPAEMRATRDLLHRRNYLTRKRADLLSHIQNTNSQYNMEPFAKKITYKSNRDGVADQFIDPDVRMSVAVDLELIAHLERVQDFVSYARLVKCAKESAGKRYGSSGGKIGNAHLKWAFSEAAVLFLRNNPEGMKFKKRLEKKHGKAKSLRSSHTSNWSRNGRAKRVPTNAVNMHVASTTTRHLD